MGYSSAHSPLPNDPLFSLQLQVARRADEFAHLCSTAGSVTRDREMWQQAEAECLRRLTFDPRGPGGLGATDGERRTYSEAWDSVA